MDPIQIALANRRTVTTRKPTVPPRPPIRPAVATGPAAPDFESLIAELSRGPVTRTDAEWASLLDPRIAPYTQAIEGSTLRGRAFNEYNLETKAAAQKGLSEAFLGMVTGGKPGDEGMAYAKANYGGSYMGAQAMSIAASELRRLTDDFDEVDWKLTSQYLDKMQEIPSIREEMRQNIQKDDIDAYSRKVQTATLLMDETWRMYQANRETFLTERSRGDELAKIKREKGESLRDFKERKRQFDEQMKLAGAELGVDTYKAGTSRINAGTSAKNAATSAAQAEIAAAREARQGLKDKASIRQADARIRLAKENLKLQQQKARQAAKPGGSSDAQKAETDLALDIMKDRDAILGKPVANPVPGLPARQGGMSYSEAYDYILGLAQAQMPGRSKAYIDRWVKTRLKSFFPSAARSKPRGG